MLQLSATGKAELRPFESERTRRKLARYLGSAESIWDQERFVKGTFDNPSTGLRNASSGPTHRQGPLLSPAYLIPTSAEVAASA
jgi:hypothetical protein